MCQWWPKYLTLSLSYIVDNIFLMGYMLHGIKSVQVFSCEIFGFSNKSCPWTYCIWKSRSLARYNIASFYLLTHRARDKMDGISQATYSSAFSWMKMFLNSDEISLTFVPEGPLNIPALIQIMVWRCPGDKPLSEAVMVSLLTYICVTRPQWIKCKTHICVGWLGRNWSMWWPLAWFSAKPLPKQRNFN